jgi:GNAT superfamily N-acetyltransferase
MISEPDQRVYSLATAGKTENYPEELEREVTLDDGTQVRLRPIRPDDEPRLIELFRRLSRQTAYQRFFTFMKRLPRQWAHLFANVDYRRRLALVAEHPTDGAEPELISVGRYEPTERPDTAELAFVIQDGWQGRGLGRILLRGRRRVARYPAVPGDRPRREPPHASPAGSPRQRDRAVRPGRSGLSPPAPQPELKGSYRYTPRS